MVYARDEPLSEATSEVGDGGREMKSSWDGKVNVDSIERRDSSICLISVRETLRARREWTNLRSRSLVAGETAGVRLTDATSGAPAEG